MNEETRALTSPTRLCPFCSHWWGAADEFKEHMIRLHMVQIQALQEVLG